MEERPDDRLPYGASEWTASRLLRSRLRLPRNTRPFVLPPQPGLRDLAAGVDQDLLVQHGEIDLLEELIVLLHSDGSYTTRSNRISMLHSERSLAAFDEYWWEFDPQRSKVKILKARLLLPDGSLRTIGPVTRETGTGKRRTELHFKPMRPGVTVQIELQIDEFFHDRTGPFYNDTFYLQTPTPTRLRRYLFANATDYTTRFSLHGGAPEPQRETLHGYRTVSWTIHDSPGFELEPALPPPRMHSCWIEVSTVPCWAPVARQLRAELWPATSSQEKFELAGLAREITEGCTTDREKVEAIHRRIVRDFRYGRPVPEREIRTVRSPTDTLAELRGDCKDTSSLAVQLLGALGLEAGIAAILTADNGRIDHLHGFRFNHAITVVFMPDGPPIWMDLTAGLVETGLLPEADCDVRALVVQEDGFRIMRTPPMRPEDHATFREQTGSIELNGDLQLEVINRHTGIAGTHRREGYGRMNQAQRMRALAEAILEGQVHGHLSDLACSDLMDTSEPCEVRYRITLPGKARRVDQIMLLRLPWREPLSVTGPLAAPQRRLAMDTPAIGLWQESYRLALPAGYGGYGLPVSVSRSRRWARYQLEIREEDGCLVAWREIANLGGIIPPEEFEEIKKHWSACAQDDERDVVLFPESMLGRAGV